MIRPALLACAAAAFALVLPPLLRGEGFFPVGLLSVVPPWNKTVQGAADPLFLDQALQFWPWRLFLWSELRAGHLPGWNPFSAAGVPFAGCVQAAPFFPLEWLGALTGPTAFSLLAAFLKLFTAGAGAACHALQLGARRSGAALSGVTFALCGFMIAWLGHPHTNVACLLPWLFVALHRATADQSWRSWALTALVIGLILLGGHPPTELHVLLAGAAYALYKGQLKQTLLRGPVAALLGAALAAPAILPFLEYYGLSSTAAASALLSRTSMQLTHWEPLFVFLPHAADGSDFFHFGPADNFLERAAFVGLPSLGLAAAGWRKSRFHCALALFGLAAAMGIPPLPWIFHALPVLSAARPSRLLVLFCFGVSVLAGLAEPRRKAAVIFAIVSAAAIATGAFVHAPLPVLAIALAEAAAATALLALPRLRPLAPIAAAAALLGAGLGINHTAPASDLYPATQASDVLKAEQGDGRIFAFGPALAPDTALPLGLRDVRGRDFMSLRRYEELLTGRAGDFLFYGRADQLPKAPALLAISAIAGPYAPRGWQRLESRDLDIFRAPAKPQRALFVSRASVRAEILPLLQRPGFNPSDEILFDDEQPAASGTATGTARITQDSTDSIELEVDSDGPGYLLLLDTWYPGWHVEVDGQPAEVRRADYAFRAVYIPKAGHSKVRFDYRPWSRALGLWLLLLSASAFPFLVRARATAPWRPPTPPDRS
ncbi:MAG TPA: hypothetical protein VH083_14980 [Myxococcales bacterium]|nr:hypothetical protein [Myxococcales bacterium]